MIGSQYMLAVELLQDMATGFLLLKKQNKTFSSLPLFSLSETMMVGTVLELMKEDNS